MRNLTEVSLYELVPESIRDDADVKAAIEAIDGELKAVSNLCMLPAIFSRIDELDGNVLDHLAWQFNSKVYRDTWPVELKRSVVKSIITIKSKNGTRSAVERSLAVLGSAATIREWFEMTPRGRPHSFDITVSVNNALGQTTQEVLESIRLNINDTKSARSTYTLSLALQAQGDVGVAGTARAVAYARLDLREQLKIFVIAADEDNFLLVDSDTLIII